MDLHSKLRLSQGMADFVQIGMTQLLLITQIDIITRN